MGKEATVVIKRIAIPHVGLTLASVFVTPAPIAIR